MGISGRTERSGGGAFGCLPSDRLRPLSAQTHRPTALRHPVPSGPMRAWLDANVLRPPRHQGEEVVRFLVVGGLGYLLAMLLYAGEIAVGVSAYAAVPLVFIANGLFNFTLNRHWSFPRSGRRMHDELRRFSVVAAVSLLVNYSVLYLLYGSGALPPVPAQAVAIIVATPIGFLGNKLYSFARHAPETAR